MFHYLRISPVKGTGSQLFIKDIVSKLVKKRKKVFIIDWTSDYSILLENLNPNIIKYCSYNELDKRIDNRLLQIICIEFTLDADLKKQYEIDSSLIDNMLYSDYESYRNKKLRMFFNECCKDSDMDYVLEIKYSED